MSPILDQQTLELVSQSPEQTRRIGASLAALLTGGEVVGLQGELGTGKTCLVQGMARGLGITGPVTSPSFTLIQEHPVRRGAIRKLFHVDLYRLTRPLEEVEGIGLGEFLGAPGTVTVIEWAERIETFLPRDRLWVRLEHLDPVKRMVRIQGRGANSQALIQEFRRRLAGVRR